MPARNPSAARAITVTRRQFQKLTAAAAGSLAPLAASLAAPAAARAATPATPSSRAGRPAEPAGATPATEATVALSVTETDTEILVDNGPVQLTVSKSSPARLTALRLAGQDLLGSGGRGNFDMNNAIEGDPLPLPPTANSYEIRQGEDFVDIAFRYSPTTNGPFWLERHHIVRAGEPGLHLATVFSHPAELHGFRSDQHRYVFYLDPDLFTHASVEDDPIGEPWRAGGAALPTPGELAAAGVVMDATYDLDGLGSGYPRRYYTKYDWAVWLKDHTVHGLYGGGYGIFAVLGDREAFSGGPVRQDLTVHQTTSRPVLLVEPHATHYGSPPVRVAAGQEWAKTYGPHFVYLCEGEDPARLRAEALDYARGAGHPQFYDRVGLPGWEPTARRATVSGRLTGPAGSGSSAGSTGSAGSGAVVVLGDNGVQAQRTVLGYAYWADVDADGGFRIDGVRPGTYRLTAYRPGVWGEYTRDDVEVTAGAPLDLGEQCWRPASAGRTLWQIGTPDRLAAEFCRGSAYRQWGTWRFFAADFPGGVTYHIGRSGPEDWNYLQFQRIDGIDQGPWRILFDLDLDLDLEAGAGADHRRTALAGTGATATLSLALAAWSMDTARDIPQLPANLTAHLNGTTFSWPFEPDEARGATYRSGCGGRTFLKSVTFDASLLLPVGNELTLVVNEGSAAEVANTVAYDAIRLELQA